jgi:antitoxin component of MazEF toxin-antitoxin module
MGEQPCHQNSAVSGKTDETREGSRVELLATTEGFRVKKRPEHPTHLEELLARVTDANRHESVDWGIPVGNEICEARRMTDWGQTHGFRMPEMWCS